jgi:hypothetical protein
VLTNDAGCFQAVLTNVRKNDTIEFTASLP